MYGEGNGGQYQLIDIGDRSGEDVVTGKFVKRELGSAEIVFCKELGRDLSGGMAAYHWWQNFLCV